MLLPPWFRWFVPVVLIGYELGKTAAELGYTDLAVSWYQAAIALDPNHQRSRHALVKIQEAAKTQPQSPVTTPP